MKAWEKYEDAAREVVRLLCCDLGLAKVVDKKVEYAGDVTSWEIDVSAYNLDGKLVVFECRNRSRNIEKGHLGQFAYVVEDLGATGYVVSQKSLSKGAQTIADHHAIQSIGLSWDESTGQKIVEFLGRFFVINYVPLFIKGE